MIPIKPKMSDDISALQNAMWQPSIQEFQNTFSTNVSGVYFICVTFLTLLHEGNKRMLERVGYSSKIVVISSIAGYSKQIQVSIAYSATKAAATHLALHHHN
jgi:NAD(P)-dependent dehydrogenase (short-subunit alcohol dehydrogenase family)